jgi:excisionase family DNA binding protein
MDTEKEYLTKVLAADYLNLSHRSLDYLVKRGEIPAFAVRVTGKKGYSRKLLFKRADLDRWVEKHRVSVDLDKVDLDKVVNEAIDEMKEDE